MQKAPGTMERIAREGSREAAKAQSQAAALGYDYRLAFAGPAACLDQSVGEGR